MVTNIGSMKTETDKMDLIPPITTRKLSFEPFASFITVFWDVRYEIYGSKN